MKKYLTFFTILLLPFLSVYGSPLRMPDGQTKEIRDTGKHKLDAGEADGSSFEKAIIIMDSTEGTGVTAEYSWLSLHYPGYATQQQSLRIHNKRPYDVLHIKMPDATYKDVYFDISHYFGKF